MRFCTECGQPASGARFCTNCGAQLRAPDSEADPAPVPSEAAPFPDDRPAMPGRGGPGNTETSRPVMGVPGPPDPAPPLAPPRATPMRPPAEGRPGDPGTDPGSWRRWRVPFWLPIAAALVVVLGGLAGWYIAGRHSTQPLASTHSPAPAKPTSGGGSAQAATAQPSHNQSPSPAPTPSASPALSTPAATAGPGGAVVVLGPGVSGEPTAASIAAFLAQYFTAINHHDYQSYIGLFTQTARTETAQAFSSGYASTRDSREMLVALSPAQHGKTAASVTFVSHQSLSASQSSSTCTDWRIILYLRPAASSYLIGKGPASYQASFHACS